VIHSSARLVVAIATIALLAGSMSFSCVSTASADKDKKTTPDKKSKTKPKVKKGAKGSIEKGKATWYGGKWHGRKTANGEIYDKRTMTAAHKTLPFDTIVKVTNLKNNKTVELRINNRGPYGKGRIIDVSEVAAEKLDMVNAGVVPCTVEVLKVGKGKYKKHHKKKKAKKKKAEKKATAKAKK
jgi:rare lipoprotein A